MEIKREWILILASILITLFLIEFGLRIYAFLPQNDLSNLIVEKKVSDGEVFSTKEGRELMHISNNYKRVYEPQPNLNVTFAGKNVLTNSDGFRDEEFEIAKNNKTIRVIGIGDSVMYGWGIEEQERYMDLVESHLKRDYPQYNWDFMILAVPGYTTLMELATLEEFIDYEPDLVIYGFVLNDFCLTSLTTSEKSFLSLKPFFIDYIRYSKYDNSNFFLKYDSFSDDFNLICEEDIPKKYRKLMDEAAFNHSLNIFSNLSQEKDFRFVIFDSFSPWYEANNYLGKERILKFISKNLPKNILFIDPPIDSNDYEDYYLFNSEDKLDLHPNEIAHEIMAKHIYNKLIEDGVIDSLISKVSG